MRRKGKKRDEYIPQVTWRGLTLYKVVDQNVHMYHGITHSVSGLVKIFLACQGVARCADDREEELSLFFGK
jgi:hypothetical protein